MGKKSFILILTTIILFHFSINTEATNNRGLPDGISGKKPGRSVKLTEVMRITDYEDDFIFRRIRGIQVAKDDFVYVQCRDYLYKFTPEGKYIRNFITKGEGPGEVKYFVNFQVSRDSVWVGAIYPVKLLRFSPEGELKDEIAVRGIGNFSMFGGIWGRPYFIRQDQDIRKSKSGIIEQKHTLYYLDNNNSPVSTSLTFTTKNLMLKESSKNGIRIMMDELTHLLRAFTGKNSLYLSESGLYRIVLVDLKKNKIIKEFSRKYKQVEYVKKKYTDKQDIELYTLDHREFYNDIYKLIYYKGKLLVLTSTMNGAGEVLVDVFDSNGTFIDHFYLKLPGVKRPDDLERKPIHIHKGYLWTTDIDEDDVPFVLKFKIENL